MDHHHFAVMPLRLGTVEAAVQHASFPVRAPAVSDPSMQRTDVLYYRLPDPEGGMPNFGAHKDWLAIRYSNADARWLHIYQGFFAPFLAWRDLVPAGASGQRTVHDRTATWIRGRVVTDGAGTTDWIPDAQFTLAILEDAYDGSSCYTVLASDIFELDRLVEIAEGMSEVADR